MIGDWRTPDAAFLELHPSAPAFFSEAGLRFFLPAYLAADARGELVTADPLFGLIHGFSEMVVDLPGDGVRHRSGGTALLGARRYGAIAWEDASRHRLSVFCREETAAIVAHLAWRGTIGGGDSERARIGVALERFWVPRVRTAPARRELDAALR